MTLQTQLEEMKKRNQTQRTDGYEHAYLTVDQADKLLRAVEVMMGALDTIDSVFAKEHNKVIGLIGSTRKEVEDIFGVRE